MSLKVVEIKGTHYEIGYEIGKATAEEIKHVLETTAYIKTRQTKRLKDAFTKVKEQIVLEYPHFLEELQGMADAACVDINKLIRLNCRELFNVYKRKKSFHEDNCTTLTIKKENGEILISHNEDGGKNIEPFIVKGILPSKRKIITIAYPGQLLGFTVSITDKLFFSCNTISCNHWHLGIPKRFITRHALEAKSAKEFETIITNPKRAQGQNYTLCIKNKAWNIEVGTVAFEKHEIKKYFAHANNFIFPSMLQFESRKPSQASFYRNYIAQQKIPFATTKEDLTIILSNHAFKKSICMHKEHAGSLMTLANLHFNNKEPNKLWIGKGPTCKCKHEEFVLV